MKDGKKSFVLYFDMRKPLQLLSDEDRGKLFLALLDYSEYGTVPEFEGALEMAFAFIKTSLDRDREAWEKTRKERQKAGSIGGKTRVANETKSPDDVKQTQANQANACFAKQNQANQAVNVNVNANVTDTVNVNDTSIEKQKRFVPPTVEEVEAYCKQRNNSVSPAKFVDHYSAVGWKVGKAPMKDWKAAVRTWEAREEEKPSGSGSTIGYGNLGGRITPDPRFGKIPSSI